MGLDSSAMHNSAIAIMILAGLCFAGAGLLRWRNLGRREEVGETGGTWILLWVGMVLLSVTVVVALLDAQHLRFLYAVVAIWSAVAVALFLTAYLRLRTPALLLLPVAGMAMLVSMVAGFEQPDKPLVEELVWMKVLHIFFMATYSTAMLLTAAAASLYLVVARQLKTAGSMALRLPALPLLGRLNEVTLVIGMALLIGGLATGGASMRLQEHFSLFQPVPMLAMANTLLLGSLLGVHAVRRLMPRALAVGSLATASLLALTIVVLFVDQAHG